MELQGSTSDEKGKKDGKTEAAKPSVPDSSEQTHQKPSVPAGK